MEDETIVNYLIFFEDSERENELYLDKETAMKRIEQVRDNWSCHLFERILSV